MPTKLLPIKPFQETLGSSFCGPAVMKMVLEYYGVEKSESELAVLANKDDILGVSSDDIKRVLESFGLTVETKNFASYDDIQKALDNQIPVIVDWMTRGRNDYPEDDVPDGHNSIVCGLDEKNIYLQDPEVGRMRTITREDFLRVWFDFSSDHIEKWDDLIIRQMISVYKK